jgi:hypothetical protein
MHNYLPGKNKKRSVANYLAEFSVISISFFDIIAVDRTARQEKKKK